MDEDLRQLQFQISIMMGEDLTDDQSLSGLDRLPETVDKVLQLLDDVETNLHVQHAKLANKETDQ